MKRPKLKTDCLALKGQWVRRKTGMPINEDIGPVFFAQKVHYAYPVLDIFDGHRHFYTQLEQGLPLEPVLEKECCLAIDKWNSFRLEEASGKCVRELDGAAKIKWKSIPEVRRAWYATSIRYPGKEFIAYKCVHCDHFHVGKQRDKEVCPACGSGEIHNSHVGPDHYLGETYYKSCLDCDHQWDHQ